MALIVEDGTGLSNAESYCSIEFATTHLASRGKGDLWDAVDDQEAALRAATDYMVQSYRSRWKGTRRSSSQALDWPRYNVVLSDVEGDPYLDSDFVPQEVKQACAELALRASTTDLLADVSRQTSSESVGEVSVSYFQGQSSQTQYEAIERSLRPYLRAGKGNIQIARA